jgi:RimJ/RimL family protein N-acetyltransferase
MYNDPVGTFRFDRVEEEVEELSWTVAPSKRGLGVGKALVREAVKSRVGTVLATIKIGNIASEKIAKDAGFEKVSVKNNYSQWKL